MYCPEHILINNRWLFLMHWQRADIQRQYVTWAEVLNPLRYEVTIRFKDRNLFTLNDDAWLNRAFANPTWKLWRRRAWERANATPASEAEQKKGGSE